MFRNPLAALPLLVLAACSTMNASGPAGPGTSITAEQSAIQFTHPDFRNAKAEYFQSKTAGYSAVDQTAMFSGGLAFAFVNYQRTGGTTYLDAKSMETLVGSFGKNSQDNKITGSGKLTDRFPEVEWTAFDAASEPPMRCLAVRRVADNADRDSRYVTRLITAIECRLNIIPVKEGQIALPADPLPDLGEAEARLLMDSVRIK